MRKACVFIFMLLLISYGTRAQSKWYTTSGSETIFSWNSFLNSPNDGAVIRFAPVVNLQSMLNKDLSESFGIYTGVAIRNVGFIADDPDVDTDRWKFRTYNIGVPVGIKIGKMNGAMMYVGADFEYAFNFKEKQFTNGDKVYKQSYWFTDRIRVFQPSFHAGFQFWSGLNLKFKYYPQSFFNPDRTDVYSTNYERFDSNVFYISLNSNLFRGTHFTYVE